MIVSKDKFKLWINHTMNIFWSCGLMDKASDFYVYGHPKIAGSRPATIKVYPRGQNLMQQLFMFCMDFMDI